MSDPPYLSALKGEYGVTKMGWFKNYQQTFINTSRFRPLMHVMGFVLCLGYMLEYPHLKRACPATIARVLAFPRPHLPARSRPRLCCVYFL